MPTYDRFELLKEAVQSILSQTYDNWELIIKDADISGEYAEYFTKLDNRIIYMYGRDKGITDAVIRASKIANGDVILWFNDDDLLLPDTLEFVANNMGDAKWCYGDVMQINKDGFDIGIMGYRDYSYEALKQNNFIPQPAVFVRKDMFDFVGGFSNDVGTVSDYDLWLKLGQYNEPKYFNRFFAKYRIHNEQGTIKNSQEQQESAQKVKDKFKDVKAVYE